MLTPRTLAAGVVAAVLAAVPTPSLAQSAGPGEAQDVTTLPATIPIFPLPDVVLFPNLPQSLHIFEQRYRAMVADALAGDSLIGIVMLRPGYEADYEGRPPVYTVGCAGSIVSAEQLPDGRYNIVLRGMLKFRIMGEDDSRAYRLAHVEAIPETLSDEDQALLSGQRARLVEVLTSVMEEAQPPPSTVSDEDVVNRLTQFLPLEPADRQQLLEQDGPLARAGMLIDLLERMRANAPADGPRRSVKRQGLPADVTATGPTARRDR